MTTPPVRNLSFLGELYLENNSFSHRIPPEVSRLRRLKYLVSSKNSLGGEIPSNLSGSSQLLSIDLGYKSSQLVTLSKLAGSISEELGTLSKLRVIAIHKNNFTGSIPYSFSNLSSLETLSVSSNNLNGSIPDIFGHMRNLYFLGLDLNSLSGMVPPSIFFGSLLNGMQPNPRDSALKLRCCISEPRIFWYFKKQI